MIRFFSTRPAFLRRPVSAPVLRSALAAVIWVETTNESYARAGMLGFELRRRGVSVPTTDCVIAAVAESVGGRILTLDGHFEELARAASLTAL